MNVEALPIFGFLPAANDIHELTSEVCRRIRRGEPARLIVTMNVDHVVQLEKRPDFRAAYSSAWLVTIDGAPVSAFAKLKGLRRAKRITGADLFAHVFDRLEASQHRPFFVVCSEKVADILQQDLTSRGFSQEDYAFYVPPFGFERSESASSDLVQAIRRFEPTHLFFGVGTPKSEIFVNQHKHELGSCYVFSVGAALEFRAGVLRRAPVAWQKAGVEWAWRLASDPRRLYRRYLVDSWRFLYLAWKDLSLVSPGSEPGSPRG
jgi:N-acetylglucosaminyldiphosphoundecaprenol N-acetyl-beta-D-mannosaminyltransferase